MFSICILIDAIEALVSLIVKFCTSVPVRWRP